MGNRVDLESRFIKKYSPTTFVAIVNASNHFKSVIGKELGEQLWELEQEAEQLGGMKGSAVVELDSDSFDTSLLAGPPDQALHRSLYRQSLFFTDIKRVILTLNNAGKAAVRLHSEPAPLRTAALINPKELDTFNKYILLHIIPYFKKQWKAHQEDDNYQQVHSILEEVVMDKIGGLREDGKELKE